MLAVNWAWGSARLIGVLVLLRRRFAELAWFLAAEALATLGVQAWDGLESHRPGRVPRRACLVAGAQVAVAAGVRALDVAADQAAAAARSEHVARDRAATAEIIGRQACALAGATGKRHPVGGRVGRGTADPGDAQVRIRCAVQAARLRRLLAEGDEVPGSLVHELYASADMAERRGVAGQIETAGALPQVPGPARRVITDAAIAILPPPAARRGSPSPRWLPESPSDFVADTGAGVLLPAAGEGVAIEQQQDDRDALGGGAMERQVDGGDRRRPSGRHEGVASWMFPVRSRSAGAAGAGRRANLTGLRAVPAGRRPSRRARLDLELDGELVTTQIPDLAATESPPGGGLLRRIAIRRS